MPSDRKEMIFANKQAFELAARTSRNIAAAAEGDCGVIVVNVTRGDNAVHTGFEAITVGGLDLVMSAAMLLTEAIDILRACDCGEDHGLAVGALTSAKLLIDTVCGDVGLPMAKH